MFSEEKYLNFLKGKKIIAPSGSNVLPDIEMPETCFPHQKDIIKWALQGERRAIFASFGLGKTWMQLVIGWNCIRNTGKPFLQVCPLSVQGEFKKDAEILGYEVEYITNSDMVTTDKIYLTNYERIRKGDFDASVFGGVSFDEASVLRNLNTQTSDYVLKHFKTIPLRFVATATPTPNDYIEILNYAEFLGIIDRGQALTRFFQRDSTKAGNLTLYPHKVDEFWLWVSTWAMFITKPSDLGYSDDGYILPDLNTQEREVTGIDRGVMKDQRSNQLKMIADATSSLPAAAKEKRESISARVAKMIAVIEENEEKNFVLWHDLEDERRAIERVLTEKYGRESWVSVFGSQKINEKEKGLVDFAEGRFRFLVTKPKIAGSGCNFQYHCHNMIFVTINYKFNDFIQAIHRCQRFRQTERVGVWIIHTDAQSGILKVLHRKWANHYELQNKMTGIVRKYGLNNQNIESTMERNIGIERLEMSGDNWKVYNNDTVLETASMPDNSKDFIVTSIPFGDHYEYSESYNDMGHNYGNGSFFDQMAFLTPELLRVLKPGRVCAIHVKDRIRYSYQTGSGFTTIDDFAGDTVSHFTKKDVKVKIDALKSVIDDFGPNDEIEGKIRELEKDYENRFWLLGKITITTDVVRENNQTYRLGWSEKCKDGSKMGVGLPEYVLLFRKAPTDNNNAYADEPVFHSKDEYTKANWQLDAHAYWKSSGDRFMTGDELKSKTVKSIRRQWEKNNKSGIYSFNEHLNTCKDLDEIRKLSSTFMTLAPISNSDFVWTDVNRMNTLNTKQSNKKKQKHICPLQFDIVRRLIELFSAKGEIVYDPFGGLMTVPYCAVEMGRIGEASELNTQYFMDGIYHMKTIEAKVGMPTLFDI